LVEVCSKVKKPNHWDLLDTLQLPRRSWWDHRSSKVNSLSAALPWECDKPMCSTYKEHQSDWNLHVSIIKGFHQPA
jgi:hypothetical protein